MLLRSCGRTLKVEVFDYQVLMDVLSRIRQAPGRNYQTACQRGDRED